MIKYSSFLLILLVLLGCAYSKAQPALWQQLNDPELEGADIRDYLWTGNTLYAASTGGVFKSSDKGLNWSYAGYGLAKNNAPEVNSLALLNDTLFAGTAYGLARSGNGGNTWVNCNEPAFPQYIDKVVTLGNQVLMVCNTGSSYKLFASSDYGQSWSNSRGFNNKPQLFKIKNDFVFLVMGDSLFKTYNGTDIIPYQHSGLPASSQISVLCGDSSAGSNAVYAVVNTTNIWRLNLNDSSWDNSPNTISPYSEIYGLYYFNNVLLAFGLTYSPFTPRIFTSLNGGLNWQKFESLPGIPLLLLQKMIWLGGSEISACFAEENFFSSSSGLGWSKRCTQLSAKKSSVSLAASDVLLSTKAFAGILRSTNHGLNWAPANTGIDSPVVLVNGLFKSSKRVYARVRFLNHDSMYLYSSANLGQNWTRCQLPPGMKNFDFIGYNDSSIFIRSSNSPSAHLFRSTDHGNSFSDVHAKLPAVYTQSNGFIKSIVSRKGQMLTLGLDPFSLSKLYLSTDNGETYTQVNAGLSSIVGSGVTKILATDSLFIAIQNSGHDSLKLLKGNLWISSPGKDLPEQPRLYVLNSYGNRLFCISNAGFFVSDNLGNTWQHAGFGPSTGVSATEFLFSSSSVFLATENNGLWKSALSLGNPEIPLAANTGEILLYPNPAQQTLHIKTRNENREDILVHFYNMQGQLLKSVPIIAGTNDTELDLSSLPAGLYICQLQAVSWNKSQRISITRP